MQPNTIDVALNYARLGYGVFPCRRDGKAPVIQSGLRAASRDVDQIQRWFDRTGFNIAIVPPTGCLVVDIDPSETDPLNALADWTGLPSGAPTVCTPRGGRHHDMGCPGAHRFSQRSLRQGVDIRLPGKGYCLAPPSTINGVPYTWLRPLVSKKKLPLAPEQLVQKLETQTRARVDWSSFTRLTRDEGERNNAVTRLCGHLIRKQVEPEAVLELMLAWNRHRCRPPLPDREVFRIVDSICANEARREGCG